MNTASGSIYRTFIALISQTGDPRASSKRDKPMGSGKHTIRHPPSQPCLMTDSQRNPDAVGLARPSVLSSPYVGKSRGGSRAR